MVFLNNRYVYLLVAVATISSHANGMIRKVADELTKGYIRNCTKNAIPKLSKFPVGRFNNQVYVNRAIFPFKSSFTRTKFFPVRSLTTGTKQSLNKTKLKLKTRHKILLTGLTVGGLCWLYALAGSLIFLHSQRLNHQRGVLDMVKAGLLERNAKIEDIFQKFYEKIEDHLQKCEDMVKEREDIVKKSGTSETDD